MGSLGKHWKLSDTAKLNHSIAGIGKKHIMKDPLTWKKNISKSLTGKFNGEKRYWNWKGGRSTTVEGYILLYQPNHPKAVKGRVFEHRLVMEKKLKRYLQPGESVHHKNGIRNDNRQKNLKLVIKTPHHGEISCPHCNFKFLIR